MSSNDQIAGLRAGYGERYGFKDPEEYTIRLRPGLDHEVVETISRRKGEPEWMRAMRHEALEIFLSKPLPDWGNPELLRAIDFDAITYYLTPSERPGRTWDEVPERVKRTFDRLGVPQAERKFLAGVSAQYESEVVYHSISKALAERGVVFSDMDSGLREHPEIVERYFGSVVPPTDNLFAALNSAVWSGGSFIYVPKGVHVEIPLQAYFRINAERVGQFERTLIVADEGSSVHYIEGCTAPVYASESLHAAVVELVALPGARIRYTTVQNWSSNVLNLVTKRAVAHRGARVDWVDGNIGAKLTMKYPCVVLAGEGAHGEVLSLAFAGDGQHQDTGAKMIHAAPRTTSRVVSKSISAGTGRSSYRGLVRVEPRASGARSSVRCDALLIGARARSDTYPSMEIFERSARVDHEATVSRLEERQLFYLGARGLDPDRARGLVVTGFADEVVRALPMEYAVELNRLLELEMEDSVG